MEGGGGANQDGNGGLDKPREPRGDKSGPVRLSLSLEEEVMDDSASW